MKLSPLSTTLGAIAFALGLPAAAQSAPAYNVTDMWWNPTESGWAISMMQSAATNQVYALWHHYDPREPDTSTGNANDFKPIWIVMTGGTWTTPTRFVGDAFVTNGTPFFETWQPGNFRVTRVGRFTLDFTTSRSGTLAYDLAAPPGLSASDPAFGFPTLAGTKSIERYDF
jgi:hypothetical protein